MRSIFVLLILVMIGLNGKGQSVTALPDSVLSQCCLEVTLLNGNVTTVDWVFIQYITRDGTGTKLFVEYAPNFGGIQWETQIRIQDDFDGVLERSKFIMLPFTVGSTDYAINRNWIANIEENATTGGTWVYGRFGTPTKRKFSAVEDYETLKNLLLACRPRAIVVAENGLYTEGDTVRMGGFLIEPTTITTEGYNWKMKDTASTVEFGIDYNTPGSGDTTAYFARRFGVYRQLMTMGRTYWEHRLEDTTGVTDKRGYIINALDSESNPYASIYSQGDNYSSWLLQGSFGNSWTFKDLVINPYYTFSVAMSPYSAVLGASESGTGDPGNGVSVSANGYGIGADEWIGIRTKNVDNGLAHPGQFLQLVDSITGKVEYATLDLSSYLEIGDTAAMLANYVTFGNLSGYPTGTGITDRSARWSGTNTLAAGNITDNGTKVQALLPFQFQTYTTAGLPTGVTGYHVYNTTTNGPGWYNGTRWGYGLESTFNRGTSTRIPFFDANGQITESSTFTQSSNKLTLGVASGKNPVVDIVTGTGSGLSNEAAGLRLRNNSTDGNTFYLQMGTSTTAIGGLNQGHAYIQSGLWGGGYDNPLRINPQGGKIGIGATRPINWELSVASTVAIAGPLASAATSNTEGGRLFFNAGIIGGTPYGTVVTSIASIYDKSFWYQGSGLSFRTQSGVDISGVTTGGTERMRISSDGNIGIGTNAPQRLFHIAGEARITDLITDTPTRFVGADADGDLGAITVSTGLDLTSGVLTATGATTWLKTELEASRDVVINGGSSTDFRIQNTRNQFDGKTKIGSDSSFVHDPGVDSTKIAGTVSFGKPSTLGAPAASGYPFIFRNPGSFSTYLLIESGRTDTTNGSAGIRFVPSGQNPSIIQYGTTTGKALQFSDATTGKPVLQLGSSGFVSGNNSTVLLGVDDPNQWGGNGRLVIYDTITSGKSMFLVKKVTSSSTPLAMFSSASNDRFTFEDNGTYRMHTYGAGAKEASDLGFSAPTHIAAFSPSGTGGGTLLDLGLGAGLSISGGLLVATGSADGNGIYSNSGTLSKYTTRALIPANGNLLFTQRYNSNADSAYLHFVNYGGGERALNFGLTDTSSTGYSRGSFYSDGGGSMNWEFKTEDFNGNTTVKVQDGAFSVGTSQGSISLSAPVDYEVQMTGLVRAKQEAYFEITSTSSPQNLSNTYTDNLINQGGTQASFTLVFPGSPEDGQILKLTYNNAISVLTLDGNGNTIVGTTVTTAVAGSQRIFKFYDGIGWIRQN